jgi:hypothetical protein
MVRLAAVHVGPGQRAHSGAWRKQSCLGVTRRKRRGNPRNRGGRSGSIARRRTAPHQQAILLPEAKVTQGGVSFLGIAIDAAGKHHGRTLCTCTCACWPWPPAHHFAPRARAGALAAFVARGRKLVHDVRGKIVYDNITALAKWVAAARAKALQAAKGARSVARGGARRWSWRALRGLGPTLAPENGSNRAGGLPTDVRKGW